MVDTLPLKPFVEAYGARSDTLCPRNIGIDVPKKEFPDEEVISGVIVRRFEGQPIMCSCALDSRVGIIGARELVGQRPY